MGKVKPDIRNQMTRLDAFFAAVTALAAAYCIYARIWEMAGISVLATILFLLPLITGRHIRIQIPLPIGIGILAVVIFTIIALELSGRAHYPHSSNYLTNAFAALLNAYMVFLLIYALNHDSAGHLKLSPIFIAMFTLCLAVTLGTLWEILEFTLDGLIDTNMQQSRSLELQYGLLDTRLGVLDTDHDLLTTLAMALIVSLFAYFYVKKQYRRDMQGRDTKHL
jgi:predicted neutral ceramidase superfamily lipid hydrolase